MQSHKELSVWQKSMDLAQQIYAITKQLPSSERYGLVSQMQRAAISIPSNIAEGAKRNYKAEFIQFLSIATGSASELETQLLLAEKIYSLEIENALNLNEEVLKMLHALQYSLRKSVHL